jgi:hypothetical protein
MYVYVHIYIHKHIYKYILYIYLYIGSIQSIDTASTHTSFSVAKARELQFLRNSQLRLVGCKRYVYMYMYICLYIYVYTQIYIYIYIHIHIYIYIGSLCDEDGHDEDLSVDDDISFGSYDDGISLISDLSRNIQRNMKKGIYMYVYV